jgi:hypothetical protein
LRVSSRTWGRGVSGEDASYGSQVKRTSQGSERLYHRDGPKHRLSWTGAPQLKHRIASFFPSRISGVNWSTPHAQRLYCELSCLPSLAATFSPHLTYRNLNHAKPRPRHLTTSPPPRATMAEQSINVPQVIVFLIVTVLAIRWYFSKPSAPHTRAAPHRSTARINPAQIDQLAQMFPQLSRRDIAWDLQRNGGNAAATTERVLSGRGLDTVCAITYCMCI